MSAVLSTGIRRGDRVRVLSDGQTGTVADLQLIRKGGQTHKYCQVRLDSRPTLDRWYMSGELAPATERATVTFRGEGEEVSLLLELDHATDRCSVRLSRLLPPPSSGAPLNHLMAMLLLEEMRKPNPLTP